MQFFSRRRLLSWLAFAAMVYPYLFAFFAFQSFAPPWLSIPLFFAGVYPLGKLKIWIDQKIFGPAEGET